MGNRKEEILIVALHLFARDGYEAVYGQLKEIPVATGEYVAAGQCIGYISQPSKYYSAEGANLYFELRKDGNPVNPQDFLQQ